MAINLRDGDELVRVVQTGGEDDMVLVTRAGNALRFSEESVRATGRAASGVIGMRLRADDEIVSCDVARDDAAVLIVTTGGYGKRIQLDRFARKGRGTMGVRGIKVSDRRGGVAAAFMVGLDDEIFLISSGGHTVRTAVRDISSQGRDASGVRVRTRGEDQPGAAVAPVLTPTGEDEPAS